MESYLEHIKVKDRSYLEGCKFCNGKGLCYEVAGPYQRLAISGSKYGEKRVFLKKLFLTLLTLVLDIKGLSEGEM